MAVYLAVTLGLAAALLAGYSWRAVPQRSRRHQADVAKCGFCGHYTGNLCVQCRASNRDRERVA